MGCDLLLTAGCPAVLVGPSNSTGHWCRQLSESSVYTLCWVDSVNIPQSNPIASAFCLILLSVSSVYLTSSSSLVMSQPRDVLIMCPYHRVPVLFSYPTTWSLEVLSGAWQGVWTQKKPKYSLRSSLEPKGIAISREAMWYPPVMFVGSSSHATTMIYWP